MHLYLRGGQSLRRKPSTESPGTYWVGVSVPKEYNLHPYNYRVWSGVECTLHTLLAHFIDCTFVRAFTFYTFTFSSPNLSSDYLGGGVWGVKRWVVSGLFLSSPKTSQQTIQRRISCHRSVTWPVQTGPEPPPPAAQEDEGERTLVTSPIPSRQEVLSQGTTPGGDVSTPSDP